MDLLRRTNKPLIMKFEATSSAVTWMQCKFGLPPPHGATPWYDAVRREFLQLEKAQASLTQELESRQVKLEELTTENDTLKKALAAAQLDARLEGIKAKEGLRDEEASRDGEETDPVEESLLDDKSYHSERIEGTERSWVDETTYSRETTDMSYGKGDLEGTEESLRDDEYSNEASHGREEEQNAEVSEGYTSRDIMEARLREIFAARDERVGHL